MKAVTVVLLSALSAFSAPTFTQQPSIIYHSAGQNWTISFGVSEMTDVEVSIVRLSDSSIVRRLAAGKLGANPPAPFTAGSLNQTVAWDGTNDLGVKVADTSALSVRVRAGMSASMDFLLGNNPYYFSSVNGAALGADGSVYVHGVYGAWGNHAAIRKYDAAGNYLKTVYPYPAGADTGLINGWGVSLRGDNTYAPRYNFLPAMQLSASIVAGPSTKILPFTLDGKAACINASLRMVLVGDNSSIARNGGLVPLITSPSELPGAGPLLMTLGPDGNTIYMGGAFSVNDLSNYNYSLVKTGFWQDGRIYKINRLTGAAQAWHTIVPMDSIPDFGTVRYSLIGPYYNGSGTAKLDFGAVHGVAVDKAGRAYVCDRVRREVGIYDTTTWAKVGALSVAYPHQVEVNPNTGEIYVLSRQVMAYQNGLQILRKYSAMPNPVQTAMLSNFITSITHHSTLIRMAVSYGGAKPVVWITEHTVWAIEDNGTSFTVLRKFRDLSAEENAQLVPQQVERLAVDRKTETVYLTDGWSGFYKIEDWAQPRAVQCSTSAGRVLLAGEAAVGPDGYLYIRDDQVGVRGMGFSGQIVRLTQDHFHAPANFALGTNVVDPQYYGRYGIAYGDKGIAVSRTGKVAVIDMRNWTEYILNVFTMGATRVVDSGVVYPISCPANCVGATIGGNCGGVKYDYDGNLYVGAYVRASDHVTPPGFAGDPKYGQGTGAVIKFPPSGGSVGTGSSAPGSIKIYAQGYSAFSGMDHFCQCRSPRFDLDPWGRLFIPHALVSEVAVCDNNGNNILVFGQYGNVDSKGPGSPVPGPAIPLATPLCVAASDNHIYISDINNARLVRVKMDFVLDNIPQIKKVASEKAFAPGEMDLSFSPNPFRQVSRVVFSLPQASDARLEVVDVRGRLVRVLHAGGLKQGDHRADWNGTDLQGRPLAAGIYVYRLTAGNRMLIKKTILAK